MHTSPDLTPKKAMPTCIPRAEADSSDILAQPERNETSSRNMSGEGQPEQAPGRETDERHGESSGDGDGCPTCNLCIREEGTSGLLATKKEGERKGEEAEEGGRGSKQTRTEKRQKTRTTKENEGKKETWCCGG